MGLDFYKKSKALTSRQLKMLQQTLIQCCLVHDQDSYKVHINRVKATRILTVIIDQADFTELSSTTVVQLIWCIMSCIHHFQVWLSISGGLLQWTRRRHYRKAINCYDRLIQILMPDMYAVILHSVITFYQNADVWKIEHMCSELLIRLVSHSKDPSMTINEMLNLLQNTIQESVDEAREIIKVLYEILETIRWIQVDREMLDRFLSLFHKSIMPSDYEEEAFQPLNTGLEVCLRCLLENMSNEDLMYVICEILSWTKDDRLTDQIILEFGNVLEYAAILYKTDTISTWSVEVFPMILNLIASDNILYSLLGNRVFQHLIDRCDNRAVFNTPRIFYEEADYNIKVNTYKPEDKSLFRKFRQMFHTNFLKSAIRHNDNRVNLENTYTSLALLIVEVPCGYTAAAAVCLAMAMQETALADEMMLFENSHRIHALVISIMTLICYIHNAEVFYEYVQTILFRRAAFAPYLNPPFKITYHYAQHHVLWKKPDLYFEDWETRYGLWKCFRTKRANFQVLNGKIVAV